MRTVAVSSDAWEVELEAGDFRDAENKAYRALAPSLSNWAVHLDVPAQIWRIHVTELSSNNQQISIVNPTKCRSRWRHQAR